MRRLFWLGVGVAGGVALSRKAKQTARQATPSGVAANVSDAMRELAGAIGSFGADVRAGMTEREEELSDVVEQRSGVRPPGARHAANRRGAAGARARRADG
ncbi:hypothetical protein EV193_102145 [Herbihabitans rhizosphaerae]|uniref:Secreted protein n=1 Tax=Herbihabitans rhizosphaerae TaxID=1872711 RepID=A0A4Q7L1U7_9PSEU|nr:hypothetical protein [Herbihabitans rhizosphaerae]RZS43167.1 hypothetical protein EV193_102145 [Herbihabitans rhizosphaerae]